MRLPRGVLLEGPPGCGKTLLARAVAGETSARFLSVSASEFVEMFVGVGASRMRDTFELAAKHAPAILFIDELDAIGRRRGSGVGLVNDEREHTLNQLLVSLDGFERGARVVVIAATNRSDVLDAALLRPGRFDRRIAVPPLSTEARREVIAIHADGQAARCRRLARGARRAHRGDERRRPRGARQRGGHPRRAALPRCRRGAAHRARRLRARARPAIERGPPLRSASTRC